MRNYKKLRFVLISVFLLILIISIFMVVFEKPNSIFYISILALISLLMIAVVWHSKITLYKCPNCGKEFKISAFVDFFSPHFPDKKLLTCPYCKIVNWCQACDKF